MGSYEDEKMLFDKHIFLDKPGKTRWQGALGYCDWNKLTKLERK